jgi:Putative peptidoglycan binding domain
MSRKKWLIALAASVFLVAALFVSGAFSSIFSAHASGPCAVIDGGSQCYRPPVSPPSPPRNTCIPLPVDGGKQCYHPPTNPPHVTPPHAACPSTVAYGSTGSVVVRLQRALIQRRISVGPTGDDGKFGPRTQAGVINFQAAHGLLRDGIVGQHTWHDLGAC